MDDLNLKISLIYDQALAGLNKVSKAIDKTTSGSKKLKEGLTLVDRTLKEVTRETNKLTTQESKLNTTIAEQKQKLDQNQSALRKVQSEILKTGKATDAQKNKLEKLTSTFTHTSNSIKNNTNKLKENQASLRKAAADTQHLTMNQARLAAQYNATTRAEKMQSVSMKASNRRTSAFQSFGASIGRAGPTKGGLISGGAALGAGGMALSGSIMIGIGTAIGAAMAVGTASKIGAAVEQSMAEIMTRPGVPIDKGQLRKAIRQASSTSIFSVDTVAEAFVAVRNAVEGDLNAISGISKTALQFGQGERLGAEESVKMIIGATNVMGLPQNAEGTGYAANLMSAAASVTQDTASNFYTALSTGGRELKEYGHMDNEHLMATLSFLAQATYGGSRGAPLRTSVLSDKDTPKISKQIQKIFSETGDYVNIIDADKNMLPLLDVADSISGMNTKYKNNPHVLGMLKKLVALTMGGRGTGKFEALVALGDKSVVNARAKQLEEIAKGNIVGKLSEAQLNTVGGRGGQAKSQLSLAAMSLFDNALKPALVEIFGLMREDLAGLTSFLENNKGFGANLARILTNVYSGLSGVGRLVGDILTRLTPVLTVLSESFRLLTPIANLIGLIFKALDFIMTPIVFIGEQIGGILGWLVGGLTAWIKWLGWRFSHPFANQKEQDAAWIQKDEDVASFTNTGYNLGKTVGGVVAPALVGFGIAKVAKVAAMVEGAGGAASLHPITRGIFGAIEGIGKIPFIANNPYKTAIAATGFGQKTSSTSPYYTDNYSTGYGIAPAVTNTFNITIDGAKNPEEVAKIIRKEFETATFSQYMNSMEVSTF